MEYTVDYFIEKFSKIPEELWYDGGLLHFNGKRCAYGLCGLTPFQEPSKECRALSDIFQKAFPQFNKKTYSHNLSGVVISINDDVGSLIGLYQQPTPKQRILAALYDIKKLQEPKLPEPKTIIKYVSVPTSIKKEIVLN